jgi:hypothetical protein
LPLRSHSYAYYSYVPQIGFLMLAGVGLMRLAARFAPPRTVWAAKLLLGGAAVGLSMWCAARNARVHETLNLPDSLVPHDGVVRYGRAAGALVRAVDQADLPAGVQRVALQTLPASIGKSALTPGAKTPAAGMTRKRRLPLREAMRDGRLVALHFPHLQGVVLDSLSSREESSDTVILFGSGFDTVERLADPSEAWAIQAQGHLILGDRAAAEAELRRALELSPRHIVARAVLAGLLLESGRFDAAEAQIHALPADDLPAAVRPLVTQIREILARVRAGQTAPGR